MVKKKRRSSKYVPKPHIVNSYHILIISVLSVVTLLLLGIFVVNQITGKSYGTDTSCIDTDELNISSKGSVTGLVLSEAEDGSFVEEEQTKFDGCLNQQQVVEQVCDENNYIKIETIDCPDKKICSDGACVPLPPLITAEDVSKEETSFLVQDEINVSFWIITTLKDADGGVLLLHKELFPVQENGAEISSLVNYNNLDAVYEKSVVVYDQPDPAVWFVYLSNPLVVNYGDLEIS